MDAHRPDVVIAVGGGSTLDAAKAMRLLHMLRSARAGRGEGGEQTKPPPGPAPAPGAGAAAGAVSGAAAATGAPQGEAFPLPVQSGGFRGEDPPRFLPGSDAVGSAGDWSGQSSAAGQQESRAPSPQQPPPAAPEAQGAPAVGAPGAGEPGPPLPADSSDNEWSGLSVLKEDSDLESEAEGAAFDSDIAGGAVGDEIVVAYLPPDTTDTEGGGMEGGVEAEEEEALQREEVRAMARALATAREEEREERRAEAEIEALALPFLSYGTRVAPRERREAERRERGLRAVGKATRIRRPELFAVPTTSGSGAEVCAARVLCRRSSIVSAGELFWSAREQERVVSSAHRESRSVSPPLLPQATPFAAVSADDATPDAPSRYWTLTDSWLTPNAVVLDPTLSSEQPRRLAAHSGLAAVVHAVEAHGSAGATERSRARSLQALALLFEHLPAAVAAAGGGRGGEGAAAEGGGSESKKKNAQEEVQFAAALAGIAAAQASTGLCASLANALGAAFGTPAGVASAVLLPRVVRYNAGEAAADTGGRQAAHPRYPKPRARLTYAALAEAIGATGSPAGSSAGPAAAEEEQPQQQQYAAAAAAVSQADSEAAAAESLARALAELAAAVGAPSTLAEALGPGYEGEFLAKVDAVAEAAFLDQSSRTNPRAPLIEARAVTARSPAFLLGLGGPGSSFFPRLR